MPVVVDTRLVASPLILALADGRDATVRLDSVELASEDGEAMWCRMRVTARGTSWPPDPTDQPWDASGPSSGTEMLLGLVDDLVASLGGREAEDVAYELTASGRGRDGLGAAASWLPLVVRPADRPPEGTAWAARATLDPSADVAPVPPLLARAVAVLFDEGWEPRRDSQDPAVLLASVEPEAGWDLCLRADDSSGEVVVELTVPGDPDPAPADGVDADDLVSVSPTEDGLLFRAHVRVVDADLPPDTLGGMLDAVMDRAQQLAAPEPD